MKTHSFAVLALVLAACEPSPKVAAEPAPAPTAAVTSSAGAALATSPPPVVSTAPLAFVEDDLPAAMARAKRDKKSVFVDVWAPWCHTCLSMKNFVLSDPALRPLADRVVFVALDFDKEKNAAFFEKHETHNLPSYFMLDADEKVTGVWIGSGSAKEMRTMIEEALANASGGATEYAKAFAQGRALDGKDAGGAAAAYRIAFTSSTDAWPLRSEAGLAWISAMSEAKQPELCAKEGVAILPSIHGAAIPSDFAITILDCASKLSGDAQKSARDAAIARLREFVAHPPDGATVDDRADASNALGQALEDLGDKAGARAARETWLQIVDDAAKAAPTPELAHTFDYERANAFVALGRGAEAAKMLEEREKQLPDAYEPPARLTRVYMALNRWDDASRSIDRALAKMYGPRKLLYQGVKAQIEEKLGEHADAIATLKSVVKGYEDLPPGQAAPRQLEDAKKKLEDAEKGSKR